MRHEVWAAIESGLRSEEDALTFILLSLLLVLFCHLLRAFFGCSLSSGVRNFGFQFSVGAEGAFPQLASRIELFVRVRSGAKFRPQLIITSICPQLITAFHRSVLLTLWNCGDVCLSLFLLGPLHGAEVEEGGAEGFQGD